MPKQNITCSVCGTINDYDSRFCKSCIAPLNVKKLNDFDYDDYKLLFNGFLQSIEGLVQSRSYNFNFPIIKDYLNAFWLRPETALYLASEYICLQKIFGSNNIVINLDIGCGDGIHSSLINGWKFKDSFDAFGNLNLLGSDIFDSEPSKEKVVFDNIGTRIDLGIDIKNNTVLRAVKLNTFKKVVCSNFLEENLNGTYQTIFSNLIRDFDDKKLSIALKKVHKLLKPGGSLIFSSPTNFYKNNLYFYPKMLDSTGSNATQMHNLDRGRSEFCAQQITIEKWREKIEPLGFEISSVEYFGGENFTKFWDTGVRAFVPVIIGYIKNSKSLEYKPVIKNIFINFFSPIINSLLKDDHKSNNFSFQMIEITKKG